MTEQVLVLNSHVGQMWLTG